MGASSSTSYSKHINSKDFIEFYKLDLNYKKGYINSEAINLAHNSVNSIAVPSYIHKEDDYTVVPGPSMIYKFKPKDFTIGPVYKVTLEFLRDPINWDNV